MVAHRVLQVHGADHIIGIIKGRIQDRLTHQRFGGKMHDRIKLLSEKRAASSAGRNRSPAPIPLPE